MLSEITSLLHRHAPADPTEDQDRTRMLRLLETGPACLTRYHLVPGHFTASAFVLSPDHEQLLLIHHRRLDRWLQPGGHIEPTDVGLVAAAAREVQEETGLAHLDVLQPLFDLDVHTIPEGKDPTHQHHDLRVLFVAQDLSIEAGSDAQATQWMSRDQAQQAVSEPAMDRVLRKLRVW